MPDGLADVALGKRVAESDQEDLRKLAQMEHVRNYSFSLHSIEAKD